MQENQVAEVSTPSATTPRSARERWHSSGLIAFRLPSGFIVSGIWPSLTELVRYGVLPWSLRKAVLAAAGKPLTELTAEDVSRNIEHRARIIVGFLRGIYDDETGAWEQLRLTFDELTDGTLPGDDLEALDTFIILAGSRSPEAAALIVNASSEVELGMVDETEAIQPEADAAQEADATVDGWADFRDEHGSPDGDAPSADVESASKRGNRSGGSASGVSGRRRTGAATKT